MLIVYIFSFLILGTIHDNYILASSHLCCTNYNHIYQSSLFELIKKEVSNIQECSSILGFASVFLVVKCYANFLSAEISQLCYEGIIRTIALGSTYGLSTFSCSFMLTLYPLIIPVGVITLGRMFNVLGSSIDGYLELSLSAFFSSSYFQYSFYTCRDFHFSILSLHSRTILLVFRTKLRNSRYI